MRLSTPFFTEALLESIPLNLLIAAYSPSDVGRAGYFYDASVDAGHV